MPLMPIPTAAYLIMLTSLDPSPTARVRWDVLSLTLLTIYSLFLGVHLKQMVEWRGL